MTFPELCERAKRLAGAGSPSPDIWAQSEIDLAACKDIALNELANETMRDDARRHLLQQSYSVTLDANGEGDIIAATGAVTGAADIIPESIFFGNVRDAENNVLVPLYHYSDFLKPQITAFAYYCLKGRKIATRAIGMYVAKSEDVVTAPSPLTILASHSSTDLTYWSSEFDEKIVEKLVTVVTRKLEPPKAAV